MSNTVGYLVTTFAFGMMFAAGYNVANTTYTHFYPDKSEVWICIQDSAEPDEICTRLLKEKDQ